MLEQSRPEIRRIRAANFRSIESIDLSLGPLSVFVGQNGVGKSNIVDVLRFLRDCTTRGLDQALLDRGGMAAVQRFGTRGQSPEVSIEVEFAYDGYVVLYGFSLVQDRRTEYKVRREHFVMFVDGTGEIQVEYRLANGRWKTRINDDSPRRSPVPSSSLYLMRMWALHFPLGSGDAFLAADRMMTALEDFAFYNIRPETLRPPQQVVAEHPFDERGRNLAAVLRALKKDARPELRDVEGALSRLVDGLCTYEIHNVGSYLITKLLYEFAGSGTKPGTGKPIRHASDLSQESDGTLRILSILAALYQRPARPLLVIEEPEINIHPGALGVIADLLQEASLRTQVVVTTHNPDLIEHFEPEVLCVVEKENGLTLAGPVARDQQEAIRRMLFSTAEIMKMEGLRREEAGV